MPKKGETTHKVDEPHNTKHHTAKPVSFLPLTNPMPSNTHPCAISPTLASSNATTTPSTANNKKEEGGLMVAQKNKWTPPQKQGNTMGTCMAGLVSSQVPPLMVTTTNTTTQAQPKRVVHHKHQHTHTTTTNHGHHTQPQPWCGLPVLCVCEPDGQ